MYIRNMNWILIFLYFSFATAANEVVKSPQQMRKDILKTKTLKTSPPVSSSTNSPSTSLLRLKTSKSLKTKSSKKSSKLLCKTSKGSLKSRKKSGKKSSKSLKYTNCNYNTTVSSILKPQFLLMSVSANPS
jgi:hypothetical protein